MNAAEITAELERRGYSAEQAGAAITQAVRDGESGLARHKVRYSRDRGGNGFAITPLPWPGDPELAAVPPDRDHRMTGLFTLRPGGMMTISWSGELRTVTCDRIEDGGAVIRDLTGAEHDKLDRQAYDEFLQRKAEAP